MTGPLRIVVVVEDGILAGVYCQNPPDIELITVDVDKHGGLSYCILKRDEARPLGGGLGITVARAGRGTVADMALEILDAAAPERTRVVLDHSGNETDETEWI